jgi:hypothetical protein
VAISAARPAQTVRDGEGDPTGPAGETGASAEPPPAPTVTSSRDATRATAPRSPNAYSAAWQIMASR